MIINARFAERFRQMKVLPLISTTRIWKIQHNSATILQRFWRHRVQQRMAAAAAASKKHAHVHERESTNYTSASRRAQFHMDIHNEEALIE